MPSHARGCSPRIRAASRIPGGGGGGREESVPEAVRACVPVRDFDDRPLEGEDLKVHLDDPTGPFRRRDPRRVCPRGQCSALISFPRRAGVARLPWPGSCAPPPSLQPPRTLRYVRTRSAQRSAAQRDGLASRFPRPPLSTRAVQQQWRRRAHTVDERQRVQLELAAPRAGAAHARGVRVERDIDERLCRRTACWCVCVCARARVQVSP